LTVRMTTPGQTCDICDSPLSGDGYCSTCAHDDFEARREYAIWRSYLEKQNERMDAIREAAERVCDPACVRSVRYPSNLPTLRSLVSNRLPIRL